MTKKAIAILSGGLDSTVASSVYAKDYDVYAITFDYGQRSAKREIKAAREISDEMGFEHTVIDLKWLGEISNSSLTSSKDVPQLKNEQLDDLEVCMETASNVWVPARNTVFTAIGEAFAESIGAEIIIVGWDKEEAATFPDNSKEFLESFNKLITVGSPDNIEVKAPAIDLDKDEIVKLGHEVNAPMNLSYSCYMGEENHCGVCESCMRRKRAFKQAGVKDDTTYNS